MKQEEKIKKGLEIRDTDEGIEVDFLNRTIEVDGVIVRLAKVTILFAGMHSLPEWLITPAANLTMIRFQDRSRRDLNVNEVKDLDGLRFDAEQFWTTSKRKARGPQSVEKIAEKMTTDDLTKLLQNPKIAALWAKINEATE
jgi:hypothetical protein